MGSLQDALLKTGLADERRKPDRKDAGSAPGSSKQAPRNQQRKKKSGRRPDAGKSQASDLERAWRARRKAEKEETERVKQARVDDQEARRKRNLELDAIVAGRALNVEEGELPRYFEHLGRIRRVLCTLKQRDAINSGELGIVNLRGRYLIVEPEVLARYKALAADLVPDLSGAEPESREDEKDYPPVPDDLTW
ncbi:MAG TPA: DUF2058 family protein [Wenzhouxiangellaceae bacterium]|nr:DUF2058 family protein [Wenzhouxiangellaceae bacterium]